MAMINISIPDDLKQRVEEQVSRGGYSSVDAYLQSLIREDLEREIDPALEAELIRGLDSPAEEMTDSDWDQMRRDLRRRFGKNGV